MTLKQEGVKLFGGLRPTAIKRRFGRRFFSHKYTLYPITALQCQISEFYSCFKVLKPTPLRAIHRIFKMAFYRLF